MGAPGHAVCVCDAGAPVSDTSFPVFEGHLTSEAVSKMWFSLQREHGLASLELSRAIRFSCPL